MPVTLLIPVESLDIATDVVKYLNDDYVGSYDFTCRESLLREVWHVRIDCNSDSATELLRIVEKQLNY